MFSGVGREGERGGRTEADAGFGGGDEDVFVGLGGAFCGGGADEAGKGGGDETGGHWP